MTCWMAGKSRPLEATSVATKTSFLPSRNASMALVRSSWSGVGQAGVRTIIGVLGVVQDSPKGKGKRTGKEEVVMAAGLC